ncbi:MAG: L,D-transpeptidase [Rhizobiaceae bacterium]|nr:L,D-transpeptidase [Rhizobiaceae bacterium]MCV0406136.1 L,D-transpeptidase [Rhizobiaceae bacterium]
MKRLAILTILSAVVAAIASPAAAQSRYSERPPLVVSPDLSAPWVMQLRTPPRVPVQRQGVQRQQVHRQFAPAREYRQPRRRQGVTVDRGRIHDYRHAQRPDHQARTAAIRPEAPAKPKFEIDPKFLPQTIAYDGKEAPGTIVIDTTANFLYLVQPGGEARRYGVGTGKPGFEWAGTHKVTLKREWPDWRPPAEMIAREKKKGRILPVHMKGGPENPLGARALYLGSTLYRIHGTNQPWTIGRAVSSGCIRMRNEDVIDLYERVGIGTKVVVR